MFLCEKAPDPAKETLAKQSKRSAKACQTSYLSTIVAWCSREHPALQPEHARIIPRTLYSHTTSCVQASSARKYVFASSSWVAYPKEHALRQSLPNILAWCSRIHPAVQPEHARIIPRTLYSHTTSCVQASSARKYVFASFSWVAYPKEHALRQSLPNILAWCSRMHAALQPEHARIIPRTLYSHTTSCVQASSARKHAFASFSWVAYPKEHALRQSLPNILAWCSRMHPAVQPEHARIIPRILYSHTTSCVQASSARKYVFAKMLAHRRLYVSIMFEE